MTRSTHIASPEPAEVRALLDAARDTSRHGWQGGRTTELAGME